MSVLSILVAAPLPAQDAAAWRLGCPQHLRLETVRWANLTDAQQRELDVDSVRVLLWVDSTCSWWRLGDLPGSQVLAECASLGWTFELEPGYAWPLTYTVHDSCRRKLP